MSFIDFSGLQSSLSRLASPAGQVTTQALGEEGGNGTVTTLALGEEGGFSSTALGEEGGGTGVSDRTADYLNFMGTADRNSDGQLTRTETTSQVNQLSSQRTLLNQLKQIFPPLGLFITPFITQLDQRIAVGNRIATHFDTFAKADTQSSTTISRNDISTIARKDGNSSTLSDQDLGIQTFGGSGQSGSLSILDLLKSFLFDD